MIDGVLCDGCVRINHASTVNVADASFEAIRFGAAGPQLLCDDTEASSTAGLGEGFRGDGGSAGDGHCHQGSARVGMVKAVPPPPSRLLLYRFDPPAASRGGTCLVLCAEEAFFQAFEAQPPVLRIREDAGAGSRMLQAVDCWRAFCDSSCSAGGGASTFPARYAAYGHYRRRGWVVRSALKYGAEYALYRGAPDEVHAGRCVVLCRALQPACGTPNQSGGPHAHACVGEGEVINQSEQDKCDVNCHSAASVRSLRAQPTWKEIQAWSRVLTGVAKRLVLCCLHVPPPRPALGASMNTLGSSFMPDALRMQLEAAFGSLPRVAAELLVTPTRNDTNLNGDDRGTPKRDRTKVASNCPSGTETAGNTEGLPWKKRGKRDGVSRKGGANALRKAIT